MTHTTKLALRRFVPPTVLMDLNEMAALDQRVADLERIYQMLEALTFDTDVGGVE